MKVLIFIIFVIGLSISSEYAFAEQQPFTAERFTQLKQENIGKKWLFILWSVDCPACFKELALLEKIRQTKKEVSVILINVDDAPEVRLERLKVLSQYNLSDLQSLFFREDEADKSRFLVDPQWYGELPRSYFIDEQGNAKGRSGLLSESLMVSWLL